VSNNYHYTSKFRNNISKKFFILLYLITVPFLCLLVALILKSISIKSTEQNKSWSNATPTTISLT